MNRIIQLYLLLLLTPVVGASELELKKAYLPLYVQHAVVNEGTEAVHSHPRKVNFISRGAEPETTLHFINSEYIPSHDNTWGKPSDANLITSCSVIITHTIEPTDDGKHNLVINIDTTSFVIPEHVNLTKEVAINVIREAVTKNFPKAEIRLK